MGKNSYNPSARNISRLAISRWSWMWSIQIDLIGFYKTERGRFNLHQCDCVHDKRLNVYVKQK